MNMLKLKVNNKGITLIALVITIIVLLLLAGVSVATLTGHNGILTKVKEAKIATEIAEAKEAIQMEVAGSFENDGIYSTHLAKQNILNNLKPQPTVNPPLGGEDEVNTPFEVTYKGHKVNVDINGKVSTDDVKDSVPKDSIPNTSFVGCYADIDGKDGVDGIIFADKAVGNTNGNQWGNSEGIYTIPKDTSGLKKYYIKEEQVVDQRWSTEPKDVISQISDSGEDRFYVMELEDINSSNAYSWYQNAYEKMTDYNTYTSGDFGAGKENTKRMMSRGQVADGSIPKGYPNFGATPYGAIDSNDIWASKEVKNKVSNEWFVPSRAEWAAFANELKISCDNYQKHNLKMGYWSSSQYDKSNIYFTYFDGGNVDHGIVPSYAFVRLASTF